MTIIVGIICKDGIVVGCDSQATSAKGVPLKRTDYTKIYEIPLGGSGHAVLSGAGTGAFIARASELLAEKCKISVCQNPREFADICEDVVTEIFKRYVIDRSKALGVSKQSVKQQRTNSILEWQEDGMETPGVWLMAGIYCGSDKNQEWCLYTIHPNSVAEKSEKYDTIGSGSAIAEYVLARLWSEQLGVEQAIRVAVYVIEEVKKIDPFCGGPTQVLALSKDKVRRLTPREIKEIAGEVMQQDENVAEAWRHIISIPVEKTGAKAKTPDNSVS